MKRPVKKLKTLIMLIFFSQTVSATQNTSIYFNSSCDFKNISINITQEGDRLVDNVILIIKLQSEANYRLSKVTREHVNKRLDMYINDIKTNTSNIHSEIKTEDIQIVLSTSTAEVLLPSLLTKTCLDK